MKQIEAKTILTRTERPSDWFGCDYNTNLYRGCCHGCIYCDSRSEVYGVTDFDEVGVKRDALSILERELAGKRKSGVVGMGAMSDPYNPFESQQQVTRGALSLLGRFGFGVGLHTKSDLVVRDIDLLTRIATVSPVGVSITITTADDALCSLIEPNVAPASARFAALRELSAAGLFAGVLLMPLLPFVNDTADNVLSIVHRAADAGARFIYPYFGVTLRQNQRVHYYAQLERLAKTHPQFSGLRQRYESAFGNAYSCNVPHAKQLYALFARACGERGLLYKMPDIIAANRKDYGQVTLF